VSSGVGDQSGDGRLSRPDTSRVRGSRGSVGIESAGVFQPGCCEPARGLPVVARVGSLAGALQPVLYKLELRFVRRTVVIRPARAPFDDIPEGVAAWAIRIHYSLMSQTGFLEQHLSTIPPDGARSRAAGGYDLRGISTISARWMSFRRLPLAGQATS
jgi:hypothetical protein